MTGAPPSSATQARAVSWVACPMRLLFGSILLLCAAPALAQAPTRLDARCTGPGPSHPSYEPPPWLGDDPPRAGSAALARAAADALESRRAGRSSSRSAYLIAAYRWDQCFLGAEPEACRQALEHYEIAVRTRRPGPRPDQALFRLAVLAERHQSPERAREALNRLIKQHPASPLKASALILFGQSLSTAGDRAGAQRFFLRAAGLASPEQGLALYLAAWAVSGAGDTRGARVLAERALGAARGEVHEAVRNDWCAIRG